MELQRFKQKVLNPSYQKIKNIFFKIAKNKWQLYSVLFSFTAFVFLIITIQYAETRQQLANGRNGIYYDFHLPESRRFEKEIIVGHGETISSILYNIGIPNNYVDEIIKELSPLYNLRRLRAGKQIKLIISQEEEHSVPHVELLTIEKTPGEEIRISYKDGSYEARLVEVKTIPVFFAKHGIIENSLYSDAMQAGIPASVIMEMFQFFSFDVDFQRDIYRGNKFRVFFKDKINLDGKTVSQGEIFFAELETARDTYRIYRFTGDNGVTDFFNEKGLSIRKTLLKTPIHGARISSGYGRRTHPISGYSHIHRGLDFAAPKNTPIIAAGSGTIELVGWHGGYGNCIIIRHANEYKTLYAHMNAFASSMRKGRHVRQGEIIGYVGTTGVSTGYHLHYEVMFRGQQINPSTLRTPPERELTKDELERFFTEKKEIDDKHESTLNALVTRR